MKLDYKGLMGETKQHMSRNCWVFSHYTGDKLSIKKYLPRPLHVRKIDMSFQKKYLQALHLWCSEIGQKKSKTQTLTFPTLCVVK